MLVIDNILTAVLMGFLIFLLWMLLVDKTPMAVAIILWVTASTLTLIASYTAEGSAIHNLVCCTYVLMLLALMVASGIKVVVSVFKKPQPTS